MTSTRVCARSGLSALSISADSWSLAGTFGGF